MRGAWWRHVPRDARAPLGVRLLVLVLLCALLAQADTVRACCAHAHPHPPDTPAAAAAHPHDLRAAGHHADELPACAGHSHGGAGCEAVAETALTPSCGLQPVNLTPSVFSPPGASTCPAARRAGAPGRSLSGAGVFALRI